MPGERTVYGLWGSEIIPLIKICLFYQVFKVTIRLFPLNFQVELEMQLLAKTPQSPIYDIPPDSDSIYEVPPV